MTDSYNNIGIIHSGRGDYDRALEVHFKALKIREEIGDKKGMADSYSNIGLIHTKRGDYDKALEFHFKALKIREEIGYKKGMAISYSNIGIIHDYRGDYDRALEFYFKALKINEEMGDKNGMAGSYHNIGNIHYYRGDYDRALEFYFKALKINEEIGNKNWLANNYGNIGGIHADRGDYGISLEFYLKALKIEEEIGDKNGTAGSYHNIGHIHADKGDYDKALEFYFKALKINEEIGNKNWLAINYNNIGSVYLLQNKVEEARVQQLLALKIGKEIGAKDELTNAYNSLSQVDSAAGNFKSSLAYYKIYKIYSDSMFNAESDKAIAELQTKYEAEQREIKIKLLEKDNEISQAESKKQQIIIYAFSAGLLLALLLLGVIFKALQNNRKKNKIITLQKQEVETQSHLIEKQNVLILEKNKALTDSIRYAERIQQAILTSEQYLKEMFLPQGVTSSHFILYKPKDIVAGDFYWAYKTQSGKAIWLTADCTGHGVPGAFMSMIGNSLLNEIVIEKGIEEPAEILNLLRSGIIKAVGQSGKQNIKDGMDCALCCWNQTTNNLTFAGAYNPLWIVRGGGGGDGGGGRGGGGGDKACLVSTHADPATFTEILPDNQPVGAHGGQTHPFTQQEFQLQKGDMLYTFSDGYIDQFGGPKEKKFMTKRFRELILSIHNKTMPEQRTILNTTITDWIGDLDQLDDICVFGVRI